MVNYLSVLWLGGVEDVLLVPDLVHRFCYVNAERIVNDLGWLETLTMFRAFPLTPPGIDVLSATEQQAVLERQI